MTGQTAPDPARIGIADLTDEGLARYMRGLRRDIEDGIRVGVSEALWARARRLQLARLRLRMRYGAVDEHAGTTSYDRWYRLDEAPTYGLAALMDRERWRLGMGRYVLDWAASEHTGAPRSGGDRR